MKKRLLPLLFIAFLLGSCAPVTASPTQPPTVTAPQTAAPTFPVPPETQSRTSIRYLVAQIRTPSEKDGREVLTAFWSQEGMIIYYALVNEIADTPLWFQISLENRENFQNIQLSSPPQLTYTPSLPVGGVYLEHQGLISPSGHYGFQITQADNDSLYLVDNKEQSKVKLFETSDLNFRKAYWILSEKKVVFGIGPEYGTFIYVYDIQQSKLSSLEELVGYADPNVSEWALSPNGKYIAILDENPTLKLLSLDGHYSTTIPGYLNNVRWTGDSQKIFYYSGSQLYNPTRLGYFDLATNVTTDLISLSELKKLGVNIGFFDAAHDGSQLVFWQAGDIWLVSFQQEKIGRIVAKHPTYSITQIISQLPAP